ncbi:MAG: AAA family ATPase [Candidatus Omnitrophica bacterium]|nr:AAA family ATPase [Candidatus Omnitrophota bacterium]MBU1923596.1 AAA family ATPase [Candidatus Omnitrophota bacterium]
MKIALAGKGGSGKTTVTAGLALLFGQDKKTVIAVDCDPDMNLGYALDFPEPGKIVPISAMKELIAKRTSSVDTQSSGYFKLNPEVEDIPGKFCPQHNNIRLIVMGKVQKAEGGCLCPENAFIKRLISHLVVNEEVVLLDMVAGTEHLGRGTAQAVDAFLIITEPTQLGVSTGLHVYSLACALGIKKIWFIGNKVQHKADEDFLRKNLNAEPLGFLSFSQNLLAARGKFVFDDKLKKELLGIYKELNRRLK